MPDEVHGLLIESEHVKWFEMQTPKKRYKRELDFQKFKDPRFPEQWHLYNDGVNGVYQNNDINVMPVWVRGINGSGVTVSVIDDGVQYMHPDLAENWNEAVSYDFNERTNTPLPQAPEDVHGTRCAGEIAAVANNVCGVGVAYGATLAGERLIANTTTDAVEAQALNHQFQIIDIYSSSWGPNDDGMALDGPGYLAQAALAAGVRKGRRGFGNIYVFASGNGGLEGDNCNFDSYANAIETVAIGAVTNKGTMPFYGELCSAHLAVSYSGGNGLGIVTTDVKQCTASHSGTSAAAPLASGMIALMLSVRPDLGWRDIQHLIVTTAKKNDPTDADWHTNGAGRHVSHKYGFGVMDATLLVEAAEKHTLLPSPAITLTKHSYKHIRLLAGTQETDTIDVLAQDVAGMAAIEHVQVTVRIRHPDRKFLTIKLVSPQLTESILAAPRFKDDSDQGYNPWTFMTVHSWGEKALGTWKLLIEDVRMGEIDPYTGAPFSTGDLLDWSLTIHGTCGEEDVLIDPDQIQANGRTCSHTVAEARRQKRTVIVGALLITSAIILMAAGYVFYKRVYAKNDQAWRQLTINTSFDSHGDVESPSGKEFFKYPKSPIDIESPHPGNDTRSLKQPSSSGFKRSVSLELLAVRSVRVGEGELSPQVAVNVNSSDDSESDSDNDSDTSHLTGSERASRVGRRIENLRNEFIKRGTSPLTKAHSTSSLNIGSQGSPSIPSRNISKTPPPNLEISSPRPLSRSSSTASLLKRSASQEQLKKFTD
ncbi:uncharacterized protein SPPG_03275 [Spizellomyces punctatus DAOM BR117]|uniref:P/Homo B domain-containing protein n=1 Tax=Spizellomyces punctatus (strain DAOM BR117) TaxID=645134 RepID=A0A0L0HKV9_SPIPD|nr:uncharacterized protein SPPG_03275 [Spizellomyces punctatus DAOM BR117]KND01474.1 hypothetical protein SPPG_03275 [Spizellomyces punctatus DAOM BR117]|eukprot:XP_016609513.1 hypothetical protein SPPG_03275 [Spizellomyces punctatus DAOM BR117]